MSAAATPPAQAPRKWEGLVDEALEREVLGACLDQAPERRRVREAFKDVQLSIDHCLFKVNPLLLCLSCLEPHGTMVENRCPFLFGSSHLVTCWHGIG